MVARPRLRAGCGPRPSLERPREGRKIQRVSDLPGPKTGGFPAISGDVLSKKTSQNMGFSGCGILWRYMSGCAKLQPESIVFFSGGCSVWSNQILKIGLVVPLIRTVGAIKKGTEYVSDILGVCFQITSSPVTSALRSCFSFRGCHGPYTSPWWWEGTQVCFRLRDVSRHWPKRSLCLDLSFAGSWQVILSSQNGFPRTGLRDRCFTKFWRVGDSAWSRRRIPCFRVVPWDPRADDSWHGPVGIRKSSWKLQFFDGYSAPTGYNGCLFAYGQTGSGKTFTMQGAFCCFCTATQTVDQPRSEHTLWETNIAIENGHL